MFSGDEGGQVAVSEVDFFQHSVASRVVVQPGGGPVLALDYKLKMLLECWSGPQHQKALLT